MCFRSPEELGSVSLKTKPKVHYDQSIVRGMCFSESMERAFIRQSVTTVDTPLHWKFANIKCLKLRVWRCALPGRIQIMLEVMACACCRCLEVTLRTQWIYCDFRFHYNYRRASWVLLSYFAETV